ncbi:MAG: hypothetical protein IIB36_14590 [Gemmatimonadetes bacterium]|nr:hypothetical protein [Gemmatimonadota bacterium]
MSGDMRLLQYVAELDKQGALLKEKLKELEIAKAHAEAVLSAQGSAILPTGTEARSKTADGPYATMTNPKAIQAFLATAAKPQKTAEIARGLRRGGIGSSASKFDNTVYGTLRRLVEAGVVEKVGPGLWRLPEEPSPGLRA